MPDCYTHSYIASHALMRSGQIVSSHPAFLAGANGPDPLYAFEVWKKKSDPDLPQLAKRMHHEKTGEFLNALVYLATTPIQQSYVLGFLSHYAADCVVHPYVDAMCAKGEPYDIPHGRNWIQASIDSWLYYQDYKTYTVPLHAGTPVLITDDLAQVTSLLKEAILQVYELDIPVVALADTFHNNMSLRKFLISKHGIKKLFAPLLETIGGARVKGNLRSRMQPAPPLKFLPSKWVNPYTQTEYDLTLEEVVAEAMESSALYITNAMRFWLGKGTGEELAMVLGNKDYDTGLALAQPELPASEEPQEIE